MQTITTAQMRKIFMLARERGLSNELLHDHVFTMTGKESLKTLTISEAVQVIDSLCDSGIAADRITPKQLHYIKGLSHDLHWTEESGALNEKTLNTFIEKQYDLSSVKWLSVKQAAKVIEGLKALLAKDRAKKKLEEKPKEAVHYEKNTY